MKISDSRLRNLIRVKLIEEQAGVGTGARRSGLTQADRQRIAQWFADELQRRLIAANVIDAGDEWSVQIRLGRVVNGYARRTGALSTPPRRSVTNVVRDVIRAADSDGIIDRSKLRFGRRLDLNLTSGPASIQSAQEIPDPRERTGGDPTPTPTRRTRRSDCVRRIQVELNRIYREYWEIIQQSEDQGNIELREEFPDGPERQGRPIFPLDEDNIVGPLTREAWNFVTETEIPDGPYTDDNCPEIVQTLILDEEEIQSAQEVTGPCYKFTERRGINCAKLIAANQLISSSLRDMKGYLQTIRQNQDAYYDDGSDIFDTRFERNTATWDRYMGIRRGSTSGRGTIIVRSNGLLARLRPLVARCNDETMTFIPPGQSEKYIEITAEEAEGVERASRAAQRTWADWGTGWLSDPSENDGNARDGTQMERQLESALGYFTSGTGDITRLVTNIETMVFVEEVACDDPEAIRPGDPEYDSLSSAPVPDAGEELDTTGQYLQSSLEESKEILILRNLKEIY